MCGISGYNGDFNPKILDAMQMSMQHRGPDDHGIYVANESGVGFAHRRLSIIDLSEHGHQPMLDEATGHVICFNGEIYNYRELRSSLEIKGHIFKTKTDTEVLLKLYQEYRYDFLNKLKGMFAFAIYDARQKNIFIARDHFGVKPLYYANTPKGFLFASEIKSILQERSVSRELNPESINAHVQYLWSPAPHTMLKAVKKLQPGFAMLVKDKKIMKHWQYYDLPMGNKHNDMSEIEAKETLLSLFKSSIDEQLISDVPVGAFLSGGLDSSAIVALIKSQHPDMDMPCFTMRFDDPGNEQMPDLPYAKRVAKHLNVNLNIIDAKPNMLQDLSTMVYYLDEPQADPAAINTYLISSLARKQGVKVLLSGAGGDDLFTGYRRHYALQASSALYKLPMFAKQGISKIASLIPQQHAHLRRLSKGLKYLNHSEKKYITSFFNWLDPKAQTNLYGELMLQDSMTDSLLPSLELLSTGTSKLDQMLYLEMKHFLADHNLNYTDKMAMATGVEVRVPFLDTALVNFASSLPENFKQRGKVGKWILKEAMSAYLPKDIIHRPKSGFGVPLRHWLQNDLQPMMQDLLSEKSISNRGIFNASSVEKLIRQNQEKRVDASYSLLAMMNIELWCQNFIDNAVPEVRVFS